MQHATSAQSSTTGGAAHTAASGTAALQLQRGSTESLGISSATPSTEQQEEAEAAAAAAAVALPSEDESDFEDLEDGEVAADENNNALAADGAAEIDSDVESDGGWGSSEEADEDDVELEATSAPAQGRTSHDAACTKGRVGTNTVEHSGVCCLLHR